MKIKEKVLKEVLQMKWNGKNKENKLGFGLSKTIDLTITEVNKVIDEGCGYFYSGFHKCGKMFWLCGRCRELKQKLGGTN